MNWTLAILIYAIFVPTLLFLASKVDNKSIYTLLLIVILLLSLIPIGLGLTLLRVTFQEMDWTFWSYMTSGAGLFCVLFGVGAALPVYWMYKQK